METEQNREPRSGEASGYVRMLELAKRIERENRIMVRHYAGITKWWKASNRRRGKRRERAVTKLEYKLYALQEPGYLFWEDFLKAHNAPLSDGAANVTKN